METFWQVVIAILVVLVTCLIALKVYVERIKGWCKSTADLTGKTVLITGANTGIGFFTAKDLAKRNARVILACRNMSKGQVAVDKIISETGNQNVVLRQLDLSLMKSVREFVKSFLSDEARLDILINNAGMAGLPLTMTEEGFETMFATNHFGPFLLTNLLLDLLKKSQPSRIVNVSSMAHNWCSGLDLDNTKAEKGYSITQCYFSTKLSNVLFTRELARRLKGTGINSYSVHPGCLDTDFWHNMPLVYNLFILIPRLVYFKTPEEGAQTTIYCAVSEELEETSGHYYVDCKEAEDQASDFSKDMELAARLWDHCEQVTGLKGH